MIDRLSANDDTASVVTHTSDVRTVGRSEDEEGNVGCEELKR